MSVFFFFIDVKISDYNSELSKPLVIYERDRGLEIYFNLKEYAYKYDKKPSNLLENLVGAYATVTLVNPSGDEININEVEITKEAKVKFVVTEDLTDELTEIGIYQLQIHVNNDVEGRDTSVFSIPPFNFEVRERLKGSSSKDGLFDSEGNKLTDKDGYRLVNTSTNKIINFSTDEINEYLNSVPTIQGEVKKLNSQLDNIENKLNSVFVNVKYPPLGYEKVLSDGTDQYIKIKALVDYVYSQGGGTLLFPEGEYICNLPLILPSEYNKRSVSIKGCGRTNTILSKKTNDVHLTGEYAGIDSVIILDGEGTENYVGYISIEDININGRWLWSDKSNHKQTEYGIYSSKNSSFIELKRLMVSADKAIKFDGALWQSYLHDLMIYGWTRGIELMSTASTSILLDKTYVMNCRGENAIAYNLTGNYSHGNNLTCDNGGGTLYNFRYADWTISGIGCEAMDNADTVINVTDKSNVTIINPTVYTPTKDSSSVLNAQSNGVLMLIGGSIGDKHHPKTNPSKLLELGYNNSKIELINTKIWDTLNGESTKVEDSSCSAIVNGRNLFDYTFTLDNNAPWQESSIGSSYSTWYCQLTIPTTIQWATISETPKLDIIDSPVYIAKAKNKPNNFANISTNRGGEIFLTLPNELATSVETLKSLLSNTPIKLKLYAK